MLTPDEEKFLEYWSENRNKKASGFRQYRFGLSIGLIIGIGILLNFASGWYTRATMVANSQSTPLVLILAIIIIAIFCSVFYKQFNSEANEQRYKELIFKKEKDNIETGVQQDESKSSQVENS